VVVLSFIWLTSSANAGARECVGGDSDKEENDPDSDIV
jgi:hypothetical protein